MGLIYSSAAYTAAAGLFNDLIIPTITCVINATYAIEEELQKYRVADELISNEGYLNEDKLSQQIAIKKE